jgi:hypothetical protein
LLNEVVYVFSRLDKNYYELLLGLKVGLEVDEEIFWEVGPEETAHALDAVGEVIGRGHVEVPVEAVHDQETLHLDEVFVRIS